jgi:stress-induced morphogen
VQVVSDKFEGMKLIQRHRAINEVLKEELNTIHALQIAKCQTPSQAQGALREQRG